MSKKPLKFIDLNFSSDLLMNAFLNNLIEQKFIIEEEEEKLRKKEIIVRNIEESID